MTVEAAVTRRRGGFTLVELMVVIAIIAILAASGIPLYMTALRVSKNTAAIADLKNISQSIDLYVLSHGHPPDSLAQVGMDHIRDPWGKPYEYLRLDNVGNNGNNGNNGGGNGKARKDKNLVPINSDYDLYSMGADGKSASPLTAAISKDDLVRAQNGNYFGLGSEY